MQTIKQSFINVSTALCLILSGIFLFATPVIAADVPVSYVSSGTMQDRNNLIFEQEPENCYTTVNTHGNSRITYNANFQDDGSDPTHGAGIHDIPNDDTVFRVVQHQIYEAGKPFTGVHVNNPQNGDVFTITYSNLGTYNDKAIGANFTFTLKNVTGPFNLQCCSESVYNGFVFGRGTVNLNIDFFDQDTGAKLLISDTYVSLNSLNNLEGFDFDTSNVKSVELLDNTNVAVQDIGNSKTRIIGTSNDFEDILGADTFNKNTALVHLNDNLESISMDTLTEQFWMTITTNPLTWTMPKSPVKSVNKNKTYIGDEVIYTVKQNVNTMGVDTLEKYSSMAFENIMPQEVNYISAQVLDESGNTVPGTLNYDNAARKLTFSFDSIYLQSTMRYEGEEYRLVIHTKMNDNAKGKTSFTNASSTVINGSTVATNYVDVAPMYKITTAITNGTISENINEIDAGSSKTVKWKADTGYTITSIRVDGKDVEITDTQEGSYTFDAVHDDHKVEVVCEPALSGLTVTKEISADDIHFDHGNPTFIFKVEGTDINGQAHTYYRSLEFDSEYVKANTVNENGQNTVRASFTISDMTAGNYAVSEINVSRYSLSEISDLKGGTAEGERAVMDLVNNLSGSVTFANSHNGYQSYSHNDTIINHIEK